MNHPTTPLKPQHTPHALRYGAGLLSAPKVVSAMNELDQKTSMRAVAFRDLFDSSGRIYQEYQRNVYGGIESSIEELATLLIWGFGMTTMKGLLDKGLVGVNNVVKKRLGRDWLKYPNLETNLLKAGPQQLTPEVVHKYAAGDPHLLRLISNPNVQRAYGHWRVFKLITATFIPSMIIGFGIPRFNQAITRKLIRQRQHQLEKRQAGHKLTPIPEVFRRFDAPLPSPSTNRFGAAPPAVTLMDRVISGLLGNETLTNVLFIDLPLEAGRVVSTRNEVERRERAFRSVCQVFFLFWGQPLIQDAIAKVLNHTNKAVTEIDFNGLKHLKDTYGKSPKAFVNAVNTVAKPLANLSPEAFEAQLIPQLREYFHTGGQGHLLFDLAKASGKIPLTPQGTVDVTQRVPVEYLHGLTEHLTRMGQLIEKTGPQGLNNLINRSFTAKTTAFSSALFLCFLALSYAMPKTQHWITKKTTGQDYFPGVDPLWGAQKTPTGL
jgi:hypothetical protein